MPAKTAAMFESRGAILRKTRETLIPSCSTTMADHDDSEVTSFGLNRPNEGRSEFIGMIHPALAMLSTLQDPEFGGNSSTQDNASKEAALMCGGDSGFSEMELTSPGSTSGTLPDLDRDQQHSLISNPMEGLEMRDDDEDVDSDDDGSSTISELSGISRLSGQDWKLSADALSWVHRQMSAGVNPRDVLAHVLHDESALSKLPMGVDDFTLWKILLNILSELPRRKKLTHINTIEDVIRLIKRSNKILVLTGAGVSVSCGIPDFRSPTGVYARLARDFPDLPDPQAMFDIHYFNRDPRPFYKFAREIYPGQFQPSPCHRFIRALEIHGKLLRNYTQNIDTLEQVAGIERVVQCHGSFASATCTNCKRKVTADEIRDDILSQRIPVCRICIPDPNDPARLDPDNNYQGLVARGVMKPDIVFFGEGLPEDFHDAMAADRDQADLLLIIGSSLKVRPVALIPCSVPEEVPQVLINRERLPHLKVDVELLGDADVLVDHLCRELGDDWKEFCWRDTPLTQIETLPVVEYSPSTSPMNTDQPDEISRKRSVEETCPTEHASKRQRLGDGSVAVEAGTASTATSDLQWSEVAPVKFRQMSSDSTRDSGIAVETVEERRPRLRLSARLPDGNFLFLKPNRYVFPGAEVYQRRRQRHFSSSDSELDSSAPNSPGSPMSMPVASE